MSTDVIAPNQGDIYISEEDLAAIKLPEGPRFENRLPDDHFLSRYIALGEEISDAHPDYWYAGGLHTLSVLSKKNLYVKLRQGTIYPNLYICLLGKSSIDRKTTIVDKSEDLLNQVKSALLFSSVPTEFSPEAFIEHMHNNNHAHWIRDEAAGVLATMQKDYMAGFKDVLMRLYDCKPMYRKLRTSNKKSVQTEFRVGDPFLNILWATTDTAFAKNTDVNDTLTGFLARFLFHYPQRPKDKWYPLEEGDPLISEMEKVIVNQLSSIDNHIFGMKRTAFHLSPDTAEYYKEWQSVQVKNVEATNDGSLAQIFGRLVPTVIKLALLFELGSSDFDPKQPNIRKQYIEEACRQVAEYYIPTARAVYDSVGTNADRNAIDKIIRFLKSKGGKATKRDISRQMKIKQRDLDEYLNTMEENGTIEIRAERQGETKGRKKEWVILKLLSPLEPIAG